MSRRPAALLRRGAAAAALAGIALLDLVRASMAVARVVFAREPRLRPAIVAVPVALETPGGAAAFASLLSLTPGSVALHVAEEDGARVIYVHVLDADDPEAVVAGFRRDFERWIARVER